MARLLLISPGKLTGAVLQRIARDETFEDIVVAGRNAVAAQRNINRARIGAAIEGHYPEIRFVPLDLNDPEAGRKLAEIAPDVAFAAPNVMSWWRIDALANAGVKAVTGVPFATWLAFHLAPMIALRDAWARSGLNCPWVGAPYPDVVNAVLHRTGLAPTCGVGNIDECIPKARFVAARVLGVGPNEIDVRLVAQHALEFYLYTEETPEKLPPFMLKATYRGWDVSDLASAGIGCPFPISVDLDINWLTASCAARLLPALLSATPVPLHVPAPNGLVGGYPVEVSAGRVTLALPPEWRLEDAIGCNERSLAWDGIGEIEADGTVRFTDSTIAALSALLGEVVDRLHPEDAKHMSIKLQSAISSSAK